MASDDEKRHAPATIINPAADQKACSSYYNTGGVNAHCGGAFSGGDRITEWLGGLEPARQYHADCANHCT